ncbi:Hint domain-containing protein [Aestuariibius sp. HNIBRBA575]|uniref:Hint domain-containing protein n=1 Tax=Aestuariibius sp. HNIBRBA575 TaxID=3233343 RepID=UPI0034A32D4C
MFLQIRSNVARTAPVSITKTQPKLTQIATAGRPSQSDLMVPNPHDRQPGLMSGAMVETDCGWKAIEQVQVGDVLCTFDGGLRAVRDIIRDDVPAAQHVHIPGGVLGSDADLTVLPDQYILLTGSLAETRFKLPAVLMEARKLVGEFGIELSRSDATAHATTLVFDEEEVIWANTGLLLHCPGQATVGLTSDAFPLATPQLLDPRPNAGAMTRGVFSGGNWGHADAIAA